MNSEYYNKKIDQNSGDLLKLKSPIRIIPVLKVLFFLIGVSLIIAPFQLNWDRTVCFLFAAFSFGIYLWLYKRDDYYLRKRSYHLALKSVYENEISFLKSDYSPFENGSRFIDKTHPYAYDLDLFGENSIYHMINRTTTEGAGALLAHKLGSIPESATEILSRQASLGELVRKDDFRHRFMAICKGFEDAKDKFHLMDGFKDNNTLLMSKLGLFLIYSSIAITMASGVLAYGGYLPWSVFIMLFMLQFFFPLLFSKILNKVGADLGYMHKNTRVHAELLNLIDEEKFEAGKNVSLKKGLFDVHNSSDALKELSTLLKKFDQRHNAYILVLFNGLFLRDLFLLRQFYRWKDTYLSHFQSWIRLLAEMETRVAQATYIFNSPDFIVPTVADDKGVLIEASDVGHPFIPMGKRVDNDIQIREKEFLIITGANMAGKSTFLRTVGVNYVLAINGMNVCASTFNFSLFNLFSSMRNTDDLSSGTSYFKAELVRMRELIRYCRSHEHTLIILDELLKGTNSRDKLNGSILFLKKMTELPVTGIIATHDLELAKLEDEWPERFQNWCFEISLSNQDQFTYKIQRGVSQNMNATYLLQKILMEELE